MDAVLQQDPGPSQVLPQLLREAVPPRVRDPVRHTAFYMAMQVEVHRMVCGLFGLPPDKLLLSNVKSPWPQGRAIVVVDQDLADPQRVRVADFAAAAARWCHLAFDVAEAHCPILDLDAYHDGVLPPRPYPHGTCFDAYTVKNALQDGLARNSVDRARVGWLWLRLRG
jgi:hypothetical protein